MDYEELVGTSLYNGFNTEEIREIAHANGIGAKTGLQKKMSAPSSNGGTPISCFQLDYLAMASTIGQYLFQFGMHNRWNRNICNAIGGYPAGSVLKYSDDRECFDIINTVDNNMLEPVFDTNPTGQGEQCPVSLESNGWKVVEPMKSYMFVPDISTKTVVASEEYENQGEFNITLPAFDSSQWIEVELSTQLRPEYSLSEHNSCPNVSVFLIDSEADNESFPEINLSCMYGHNVSEMIPVSKGTSASIRMNFKEVDFEKSGKLTVKVSTFNLFEENR